MKETASDEEIPSQHEAGSRLLFRPPQKLNTGLPCRFQIAPHDVEEPRASENHKNFAITEPSRELESPRVCRSDL
jgi:hypothetical protein